MKKVMAVIANGFEELELIGTVDILIRGGILVDIFSIEESTVLSSHKISLTNIKNINDCNCLDYDCLFLPGGPHYKKLQVEEKVLNLIDYFYQNDRYIAAICAAPTILGKMGLLENKNYTCFVSMNKDFKGNFIDTYSVIDYPFITGKSAAASIDFGLDIVKVLLGDDVVNKIKEDIYY